MIHRIIAWSASNPFLIGLGLLIAVGGGLYGLQNIPLDAIPDLSDVQVIILTEWAGRSPDLVEDQITYPVVTALISAPQVKVVRGYSFFGLSFVYVIFEDGTDMYWARSRVMEYMNRVAAGLPEGVIPALGPDATGVGWVFEYALIDETGGHDLGQLRTLNDWTVRYWLEGVEGVAEVASVGGYVEQYQVSLDPTVLLAYNLPVSRVIEAIRRSNNDVGGRVIELAGTEYMVRGRGYIGSLDDLRAVTVGVGPGGTPILLRDVASISRGPDMRRGLAEFNGTGEAVGGIVVMRYGENALAVIDRIKARIEEVRDSLPEGVEIVTAYDRSDLIQGSVDNLRSKLLEESLIVAFVCLIFLFHIRSALVAILALPVAILMSIGTMYLLGMNSNIMSLGGIAIAIGAMIDAAIVMVENAHKHLEEWEDGARSDAWHPHRRDHQRGPGSRQAAVLLTADHHGIVPAGVHTRGAGRTVVSGLGPVRTAWVSGDDALLAFDRNGNGVIDSGRELFGTATLVGGRPAADGFEALAPLDRPALGGNGNGLIEKEDLAYSALLIWRDRNGDGFADQNELQSLEQANIVAIELSNYREADRIDKHGNDLSLRGRFIWGDGRAGELVDVFFVNR